MTVRKRLEIKNPISLIWKFLHVIMKVLNSSGFLEGKNPISEADLEWIFARNYEGTE